MELYYDIICTQPVGVAVSYLHYIRKHVNVQLYGKSIIAVECLN